MKEIIHKPVLVQEVCNFVPKNTKLIVDGTLGHGGHSLAMLGKGVLSEGGKLIGLDVDELMLKKAEFRLQKYSDYLELIHGSYKNVDLYVKNRKIDYLLLDIGVNLEHFKNGDRGFSVQYNANLDMRFDKGQKISAFDIVNNYSREELERVFVDYAEFRQPVLGKIINEIILERKKNSIVKTKELKEILYRCGLGEKACIVIFQALRIEVNHELQNLRIVLSKLSDVLAVGGRCAVISYHSLEDRIVKNMFKNLVLEGKFKLINKKVIMPNYLEIKGNRSARSAKLRIIELIGLDK